MEASLTWMVYMEIYYGKKHEKLVKWMNFMEQLIKMDAETSLCGMILAKQ
jgi:hypothetical protein